MAALQKLFLGPGTLRFPKVSKPDTYGEYADNKYKTDIILDVDDPTAKEAVKVIHALLRENGIKNLIKVGKARTVPYNDEDEEHPGQIIFGAKSKDKPWIGDAKNRRMPDNLLIGGGTKALIQVAVNCHSQKIKGKMVPQGVNLYLNAVQVLDLVEYQSRDKSPFEETDGYEFEGFETSTEGLGRDEADSSETADIDDEIPF